LNTKLAIITLSVSNYSDPGNKNEEIPYLWRFTVKEFLGNFSRSILRNLGNSSREFPPNSLFSKKQNSLFAGLSA